MRRDRHRREDLIATVLLALLVIAAFANVVFGGRSLVGSDSHDPLDYRMRGPDPVPIEEWTSRGLVLYPNFRDLASIVMQPTRRASFCGEACAAASSRSGTGTSAAERRHSRRSRRNTFFCVAARRTARQRPADHERLHPPADPHRGCPDLLPSPAACGALAGGARRRDGVHALGRGRHDGAVRRRTADAVLLAAAARDGAAPRRTRPSARPRSWRWHSRSSQPLPFHRSCCRSSG
jgi:hypothetical protein